MLEALVAAQLRQPAGQLGRLAGWIMANRPSNRLRNRRTLDLLDLAPGDRVLEIGYGPGFAIELASRRLPQATIVGWDHSAEMFHQAARRNAAAVAAGRVSLRVGDVLSLPHSQPSFDKIFSVNVVQFWPDPAAVLTKLNAVLVPGGRLATTFMPRVGRDKPGQARAHARELSRLLDDAAFTQQEVHWIELSPVPVVCIVGSK
jgi:ubiquinone/menaquinone biosynthesis C-methylase UbiE